MTRLPAPAPAPLPLSRRAVLGGIAAGGALLAAPALGQRAPPHVVVIGAGPGGATAARALARAPGAPRVTLVEANAETITCFFSNLYLGGLVPLAHLRHGHDRLAATQGLRLVHDRATAVDRDARRVVLAGGEVLDYDRLVLSPGIDFVPGSVPGWSEADAALMPHSYKSGDQVALLMQQVQAMPQGGTVAIVAPPAPYRCPPAPYERAAMIARTLRRVTPTAKILILDPKDHFTKQVLFEEGWGRHADGMIDWIGPEFGGAAVELRPDRMELLVEGEVQRVDVCNVIPAQRAGVLAQLAGLTDASGWVPVQAESMRAQADPAIWVLGDAADAGAMPKGAFAAHAQAYVAADAILADLAGTAPHRPLYESACWSCLGKGDSVKLASSFAPQGGRIEQTATSISQPAEDAATRRATYDEAFSWYHTITAEMFG